MTKPKAPRTYDASRRRARAQESRARMLSAARELFMEVGYSGTTLASIAQRANVALPTLYAAFGGKRALLAELIEGTDGAPRPTTALDRAHVRQIREVEDPAERIRAYVQVVGAVAAESADLLVQLRAAAGVDPEAANLEERLDDERYAAARLLANSLNADRALREGMTAATAADTLWTLGDLHTYVMLVRQRGWKPARYERWLTDVLVNALLDPTPG